LVGRFFDLVRKIIQGECTTLTAVHLGAIGFAIRNVDFTGARPQQLEQHLTDGRTFQVNEGFELVLGEDTQDASSSTDVRQAAKNR
jgi:hypothetical protein